MQTNLGRDTRTLVFDDCRVSVISVAGLGDVEYLLSGSVDLVKQHDSYGQSSLDLSLVEIASLSLVWPGGGEISTSGSRVRLPGQPATDATVKPLENLLIPFF